MIIDVVKKIDFIKAVEDVIDENGVEFTKREIGFSMGGISNNCINCKYSIDLNGDIDIQLEEIGMSEDEFIENMRIHLQELDISELYGGEKLLLELCEKRDLKDNLLKAEEERINGKCLSIEEVKRRLEDKKKKAK